MKWHPLIALLVAVLLAGGNALGPAGATAAEQRDAQAHGPEPAAQSQAPRPTSGPPKAEPSPGQSSVRPTGGTKPKGSTAPPAPAQPAVKPKLGELVNGGFEKGLAGWQIVAGSQDNIAVDSAAAKSGGKCLRLAARRSGINPAVAQRFELPGKPGWLVVRLFIRPTLIGRARVVVRIETLGAHANILRRHYLQDINADPKQWRERSARIPLTGRETAARLTVRLVGTGGAWIDDVQAKFTEATLLLRPARVALDEGTAAALSFEVLACADGELRASVDGKPAKANVHDGSLRVEIPALKAGRHALVVEQQRARFEVQVWCAPAKRKPGMLTDGGWWDVRGKKVAPIVLMHASPGDAASAAERAFSAIEVLPPASADSLRKLLKSAPRDRPGLVVPVDLRPPGPDADRYLKASLDAMAQVSADRRILAWIVADEPDVRVDLPAVPDVYLRAKKADHLHPMLVTLGGPYDVAFWRHFADGLVVNVCSSPGRPEAIFQRLRRVGPQLEPWQPLGALLPAGWTASGPQPDAEQARLNAFAAAAAGCQFFAWYCLHATGWDLRGTPLWPALGQINEDLDKLVSVVAGLPAAGDVQAAGVAVHAAWGSGDSRVVLLVNPSPTEKACKISLPRAAAKVDVIVGKADTQSDGQSLNVKVAGRSVVGLRVRMAAIAGAPTKPGAGRADDTARKSAPSAGQPADAAELRAAEQEPKQQGSSAPAPKTR